MASGLSPNDIVLVVEDNNSMRHMIVRMLRSALPARIVEAANGEEAARLLVRLQGVRIVVTDLEMHPVNGLDLLKQIRSGTCGRPDVPVLMLTGHTSERMVRAAAAENVNAFLAKPVAPQALLGRIRSLLAAEPEVPRSPLFQAPVQPDALVFDLGLE